LIHTKFRVKFNLSLGNAKIFLFIVFHIIGSAKKKPRRKKKGLKLKSNSLVKQLRKHIESGQEGNKP